MDATLTKACRISSLSRCAYGAQVSRVKLTPRHARKSIRVDVPAGFWQRVEGHPAGNKEATFVQLKRNNASGRGLDKGANHAAA